MESEFLDPGPDQAGASAYQPYAQPYHQPYGDPNSQPSAEKLAPTPAGRREVLGLLVMLVAASVLPLVASGQTLFAVHERTIASASDYALDAWGQFDAVTGTQIYTHGPRFGIALVGCGTGFAVLLLAAAVVLLGGRSREPQRVSGLLAGAATGLVGLLLGTLLAMTLEIESAFDTLRTSAGSGLATVIEVRLRIGGAVWLAVAGVLAGALAVSAALRVRRLFERTMPGHVFGSTSGESGAPPLR